MMVRENRWLRGARVGCLVVAGTIGSGTALGEEKTDPVAEKHADIERLMEVTKAAEMGAQMGELVALQVVESSGAETPEAVARCREIAAATIREILADKALMKELIPVYDKHFSHEEIREMIAFYDTPLGKKSIEVLPQVMADSMQVGQRWAARVIPEVQKKVAKQMREERLLE